MEPQGYFLNIINHIKKDGHIFYVFYVENRRTGIIQSFSDRYSILQKLYEKMKKEANNRDFPNFPSKKFMQRETEAFIEKREKELKEFFEEINKNENYLRLPSLISYIEESLKKSPNKKIISSKKLSYAMQFQNQNNNIKYFLESKRLSPEEYKNELKNGKKIVDDFSQKFVSLDYDIDINSNDKKEKKYEKIMNEEKILNHMDNDNLNKIEDGNNENFNFIGKDEENINIIEKQIKIMVENNLNKFNNLSKMIDFDEFLLK